MLTPEELFGDRITSNKKIRHVFYLTNHEKNTIEHESLSIEEFARLNANMLFSELYLGMEIINHALMLPGVTFINSVPQFVEGAQRNIQLFLHECNCVLIKVPFRSDPRALLKYMLEQKLIEK